MSNYVWKSAFKTEDNFLSGKEELSLTKSTSIGLLFFILFTFFILAISLFSITMIKGPEYARLARENTIRKDIIPARRGIIYDDEMQALVNNKPTFDLYIKLDEVTPESKNELAKILKTTISFIDNRIAELQKEYQSEIIYIPSIFKSRISHEVALQLKSQPLKGFLVIDSTYRDYPLQKIYSHILGYTSIITAEDLQKNSYLIASDQVGRVGLEAVYDEKLRGKNGYQMVEVDSLGQVVSRYISEKEDPAKGSDLKLSINTKWQKKMDQILQRYVKQLQAKGGAAVVINVRTGAVKTMVSYPSYDNNQFIGGISQTDYSALIKNPQAPLLNRVIGAQLPPGSTFKTLVAPIALQEKAITPYTIFNSTGVIYLSGGTPFQEFAKHSYGQLNVREALMVSSNIFFCRTMLKLSIEKFDEYGEKIGLGKKTGIDLLGEASGRLPSPKNKISLARNGAYWLDPIWYPEGDSCNSAIGQGITLVTPIQLVTFTAMLANGGEVLEPHLVDKIIDPIRNISKQVAPVVKMEGLFNPQNLQIVREGMRMSVNGSRAIIPVLNLPNVAVAAKTGTAEFGTKDKYGYENSHAWVTGFFPYDNPQYAFAVLLEGGGRSIYAAQVVGDWLKAVY